MSALASTSATPEIHIGSLGAERMARVYAELDIFRATPKALAKDVESVMTVPVDEAIGVVVLRSHLSANHASLLAVAALRATDDPSVSEIDFDVLDPNINRPSVLRYLIEEVEDSGEPGNVVEIEAGDVATCKAAERAGYIVSRQGDGATVIFEKQVTGADYQKQPEKSQLGFIEIPEDPDKSPKQ